MQEDEYYIELNLIDAPPKLHKYPVGNIVPFAAPNKKEDDGIAAKVGAFIQDTPPYRWGVGTTANVYDAYMRAYDKNDSFDTIDPTFDSLKVWKDNGHSPDEFDTIGPMKNWNEYYLYKESRDLFLENQRMISEMGIPAQAANFVLNVATDPTTYAGFGAASMLAKGTNRAAAFGLSAAGAVATTETIDQLTDVADMKDSADSVRNVAMAAVFGGLLGKGVDTWKSLKAKKIVSENDDFYQWSKKKAVDAQTLPARAMDLSAAAIEKNPEDSLIFGGAARTAARFTRWLSPKQWMQTAADAETRVLGDRFFGRNLMTEGDVRGLQREESLIEIADFERTAAKGQVSRAVREIDDLVSQGNIVDDEVMREAVVRASNITDDLSDKSASSFIARKFRDYFSSWEQKLSSIDEFRSRSGYVPMMWDSVKISKNYEAFTLKIQNKFKTSRAAIQEDLADLESKLARAKKQNNEAAIKKIEDEIETASRFTRMSDEELNAEATAFAEKVLSGDRTKNEAFSPFVNKTIPRRFMERVFDINEFSEFIETNPAILMMSYADEVAPYFASFRRFGTIDPMSEVARYKQKMMEKSGQLRLEGKIDEANKITEEVNQASARIEKGWDHVTGMHVAKFADLTGGGTALNIITAARNYISATKLGARVLASLNELGAIIMTRHFSGLASYGNTLRKMATSPELRSMARADAELMAYALNTSTHASLGKSLFDNMASAEVRGTGASAKVARASQWLSNGMQRWSGGVWFDHQVRQTIRLTQQGLIKNSLEQLIDGSISEMRKRDLAFLGISSKSDARAILAQAKRYGETVDGIFFFRTDKFDNKALAQKLEMAMLRDNRRVAIDPKTGDVPHLFFIPGANLLTQFKAWSVTAGQVYGISALQRTDAKSLMSMAAFVGISSMAYMFAEVARGNEPPKEVDEIIYAGITNSGLLGVLPDYGGHWMASTLFDLESGGAKFSEYQRPIDVIAGPAGSTVSDVFGAAKPIFDGIDPEKQVEFDANWMKNILDVAPVPLVKPMIKNELLTND